MRAHFIMLCVLTMRKKIIIKKNQLENLYYFGKICYWKMLLVTMLKILTWIYNCFLSPNGVIDILRPPNTVNVSLLKGFIIIYSSPAACAWYTKYYVQLCFHLSLSLSPSFSHTLSGLCHSSCCIFYNTIVILNEENNELWIVNAGVMAECFVCVWSRYRLVSHLQPLMWRALKVRSEK